MFEFFDDLPDLFHEAGSHHDDPGADANDAEPGATLEPGYGHDHDPRFGSAGYVDCRPEWERRLGDHHRRFTF